MSNLLRAIAAAGTALLASIANADVIGWHDITVDSQAQGWTCDTTNTSRVLTVQILVDGAFWTNVQAGGLREQAVGDLCGGQRYHGWVWVVPAALRNGQTHSIKAMAYDASGGGPYNLSNTPQSHLFPASPQVVGAVQFIKPHYVWGWACDPADPNRVVTMTFRWNYGEQLSQVPVQANMDHDSSIAGSCGGSSAHGFQYVFNEGHVPSATTGYLYTIGISSDGGEWMLGDPISTTIVANPTVTTIFQQPNIAAADVDSVIEPSVPYNNSTAGNFYLNMTGMGYSFSVPRADGGVPTWNTGTKTGLTTTSTYQRGTYSSSDQQTTAQAYRTSVGGWIDSTSPGDYTPASCVPSTGCLLGIIPSISWVQGAGGAKEPTRPWANEFTSGLSLELVVKWTMQVKTASNPAAGAAYSDAFVQFQDRVSGKFFWFAIGSYDNRGLGGTNQEGAGFDPGSGFPIVGVTFPTYPNNPNIYQGAVWNPTSSLGRYPQGYFFSLPHSEAYDFRMNGFQFENLLRRGFEIQDGGSRLPCGAPSGFSCKASDYQITNFNITNEVTGWAGYLGQLGFNNSGMLLGYTP